MIPYNKKLVANAQELRKNMTPEEKHLWYDFLKKLPYNVHRQHNIGNYIVDFYIAEKKIVIELDGLQHLSREHKEEDEKRDSNLSLWGIKVLRYSNDAVRNQFRFVVEDILENLGLDYSCLSSFKTKM
jgi:very-short-patch-repair endonuclease